MRGVKSAKKKDECPAEVANNCTVKVSSPNPIPPDRLPLISSHHVHAYIYIILDPHILLIHCSAMEVESVKCECCGLSEDCTAGYISMVRASFEGKWLCGLCAEAVRDEDSSSISRRRRRKSTSNGGGLQEAIREHMFFCSKSNANPAVSVAEGMRQILRRRSAEFSMENRAVAGFPKVKHGGIEMA